MTLTNSTKLRSTLNRRRRRTYTDGEEGRRGDDGGGNLSHSTQMTDDVMSKLETMDSNINEIKMDYKRTDQKLEKILCESFEIRRENVTLKKKLEIMITRLEDLSDDVDRLEKKLKEEKEKRNDLEQYTRKDNIKIINLQGDRDRETEEETEKLVMNLLHRQMGLTAIKSEHISIAHRVGPFRNSQNRPVIVRFTSRKVKTLIMKNKRMLKTKLPQVYLNDDLTKLNAQRLAELKKHEGVMSAWTFQGTLYCRLLNLQVMKMENGNLDIIDRILIDTPPRNPQQRATDQRFMGRGGHRNQHFRAERRETDRDRQPSNLTQDGQSPPPTTPGDERTSLDGHQDSAMEQDCRPRPRGTAWGSGSSASGTNRRGWEKAGMGTTGTRTDSISPSPQAEEDDMKSTEAAPQRNSTSKAMSASGTSEATVGGGYRQNVGKELTASQSEDSATTEH